MNSGIRVLCLVRNIRQFIEKGQRVKVSVPGG